MTVNPDRIALWVTTILVVLLFFNATGAIHLANW